MKTSRSSVPTIVFFFCCVFFFRQKVKERFFPTEEYSGILLYTIILSVAQPYSLNSSNSLSI